jgi:hypothetical protein
MTGQIPKYGAHFTLTHLHYHATLASRQYTLKGDDRFYIRSDKTSEIWHTFGPGGEFGEPQHSLTAAMPVVLRRHKLTNTERLFKVMSDAADDYADGKAGGDELHSAVVDYTDAVNLARLS